MGSLTKTTKGGKGAAAGKAGDNELGGDESDSDNELGERKKTKSCLLRGCSSFPCCCCCCCGGGCCSCCSCWSNRSQRNQVLLILVIINCGFAALGFFRALVQRPDMNRSFYWAKAGGSMLNFNCAAIFLPVARNFLSWLRTTPIGQLIPLDDNILFHKSIALGILIAGVLHIGAHYMNFWAIAAETGATNGLVAGILQLALGSWHGITGHAVLIMMCCMYTTAGERCRRGTMKVCGKKLKFIGYNLFWETHKMWVPMTFLLLLHGQNFWIYVHWPVALMFVEKMIRSERAKHQMRVLEVKKLAGDVMMVKFISEQHPFRYKAGQYLYLNCPAISRKEWHPFTISSAPEDEHISCHIRCRRDMDWCYSLKKTLNPKDRDSVVFSSSGSVVGAAAASSKNGSGKRKKSQQGGRSATAVAPVTNSSNTAIDVNDMLLNSPQSFQLRVDGPYGSAAEEVVDYKVLCLVGAGIGVTPFASIIRSLVLRSQKNYGGKNKKGKKAGPSLIVHFYWLCRDKEEFLSFRDLMKVQIADRKSVHFNLFMSGECEVTDPSFQRELNSYKKWSSLYTGRPNWKRIFQELRQSHKGNDVGVFLCGPRPIALALQGCCKKFSDDRPKKHETEENGGGGGQDGPRTYFTFHQENF